MRYFSRLLTFFLLSTLAWALVFSLSLNFSFGLKKGVLYGIEGGVIVAFLITVIGAGYDYLIRRRVFSKYGKKDFELVQMRDIIFKGDIKNFFPRSVAALKKVSWIKDLFPDFESNNIKAITRTTWGAFGEKIDIEFYQEGERIRVIVRSKPRIRTAIFDCGKNIENVEIFCDLLKREAT